MGRDQEIVEIDFDENKGRTHEARGFLIDSDVVWIPLSLLGDVDEQDKTFEIPEWFALKKGLI